MDKNRHPDNAIDFATKLVEYVCSEGYAARCKARVNSVEAIASGLSYEVPLTKKTMAEAVVLLFSNKERVDQSFVDTCRLALYAYYVLKGKQDLSISMGFVAELSKDTPYQDSLTNNYSNRVTTTSEDIVLTRVDNEGNEIDTTVIMHLNEYANIPFTLKELFPNIVMGVDGDEE